jgi:hypothetical protein
MVIWKDQTFHKVVARWWRKKMKGEKMQIRKIRNESEDIAVNFIEIKMIIIYYP